MLASSIEELEIAFQQKGDDISFVKKLLQELNHRSTKRARMLKALAAHAYQARIATSEGSESEDDLGSPRALYALANRRGSEDRGGELPAALSWPIEILGLPTRAFNLLTRLGARYLGETVAFSEADLLRERGGGPLSLRAIEEALGQHGLRLGMPIGDWCAPASPTLPEFDVGINDPPRGRIEDGQDLHDTLARAIAAVEPLERNWVLVARQTGWDGNGCETLEAVGQSHGLTRERVRQIVARTNKRLKGRRAPRLVVQALEITNASAPCTLHHLESILETAGIIRRSFHPAGLITAADSFGLSSTFEIFPSPPGLLIPAGQAANFERIPLLARRNVSARGCGNIRELAETVAETIGRPVSDDVITELLSPGDGFELLDSEDGWFWYRHAAFSPRNRLVNTIKRVLAASPQLRLGELRDAVRRIHRMGGFAPPTAVLRELCTKLDFLYFNADQVERVERALNWTQVLGPTETTIITVMKKFGPVIPRVEFMRHCADAGMNENTFIVYSTYSPVLWRPAPGLYAIVGSAIPLGTIEMIRQQRVNRGPNKLESGWTPDGRVYASWKISPSNLASGIVNIPTGLRSYLQGEFALSDRNGKGVGSVKITDSDLLEPPTLLSALRRG